MGATARRRRRKAGPGRRTGESRSRTPSRSHTTARPARLRLVVLRDPTGRDLDARHMLGGELGRGEFGVTYLCTEAATGARMACKSISKRKLRTPVDIEDIRREVEISATCRRTQTSSAAVQPTRMTTPCTSSELCEGGELFNMIIARGHYTECPAAAVTRTIVEVVQMCHRNDVIHRDLKPENFLYANKKESSSLKAIDFGLSVFFRPGMLCRQLVLKNLPLQ